MNDDIKELPQLNPIEEAVNLGHYQSLMQALAMAMPLCLVWRAAESQKGYSLKTLYDFALKFDAENPLPLDHFYRVSGEGAIGLSTGFEYETKWIFIPMEPCQERDFLLQDMRERVQAEKVAEAAPQEVPQQPVPQQRLCPNCGKPLIAGNAFCTHCGHKLTVSI